MFVNFIRVICTNLIVKNNKFLLVQETKKVAKGQYSFPGGNLELQEDLLQATQREAKEETGLTIKPQKLLGIFQKPTAQDGNNVITLVFYSTIKHGTIKTSKEHPEVRYFSYSELLALEKKNLIRHSYMLPAIQRYKQKRFHDRSLLAIFQKKDRRYHTIK